MFIEFKKGKKYASKDADVSNDEVYFRDAGWILEESDLVVDIDCLSHDKIKNLLKVFNINTHSVWTERGVHLYFKKPLGFRGAKKICKLGFEIEYKHIKNSTAITVKRNGVMRMVSNAGIREPLADIFASDKRYASLLGMCTGEGRNNALFKHRMQIAESPNYQEIICFVNEIILEDKLSNMEIENILKDKTTEVIKNGEYAMASQLINEMNIHVYRGEIYFYNGLNYENDDLKLKNMIYKIVGDQKTRYVDEITRQMLYRGKQVSENKTFSIKVKNGVLYDGNFIDVEYREFTPYYIDIEYKEGAVPVAAVDEYVEQLTGGDEEYKDLLFQILAHTLITDSEMKRMLAKFFIFVGDGGNGKGTLLGIIRRILGSKNCTGLSIKEMSDERYVCNLELKLANLGDDIQDQPINDKDMKVLKNISTCDFIELRRLFKNSISATMTASLIFTSNHILKSWEKGESYRRRVMWLPMYAKPSRKDARFITKLTTRDALEYWLCLIVQGYMRLYEASTFSSCRVVEDFNAVYHEENNAAVMYVKDLTQDDILGKTGPEVYEEYKLWCEENEFHASKKMLMNAVLEVWGMRTGMGRKEGKTVRVYQRIESATDFM